MIGTIAIDEIKNTKVAMKIYSLYIALVVKKSHNEKTAHKR